MKYSLLLITFFAVLDVSAQTPALNQNPMYYRNDLPLSESQVKTALCRDLYCAVLSSETEIGSGDAYKCSETYELVLKKVFNKNFSSWLAWHQENKGRDAFNKICNDEIIDDANWRDLYLSQFRR